MAMVEAVAKVVEQGKQIASHLLEAAVVDIEFAAGRFTIAGTLDVKLASEPVPAAFPNGCHVA
jgi:aerobic carbon-monoxide dehydrogenase large subunit